MNKRKILSLLFAGSFLACFAQVETNPERGIQFKANPKYRSTTMNFGSADLKNSYLSPLSYTGFSFGFRTDQTSYKEWGVLERAIGATFDGTEDLLTVGIKMEYYGHYNLYKKNNLFLYAGAGVSLDFAVTENVNSLGYNSAAESANLNFLPSVMLKWRFKLVNQHFDFSQQLSIPVIGVGVYPKFSSETYNSISESENTKNREIGLTFTSLHNSFGLNGRTYLDWRQRDNKTGKESNSFLRVGYLLDGFRLKYDENRFQTGRSVLTIGIVHKL